MALAIDGSTPAKVTGLTSAITSASFSPPAGSLILALVGRNHPNSTPPGDNADGTVTGSGGLTYAMAGRKTKNAASTGGAGTHGGVEIWWAYAASAPGSITVTDTRAETLVGTGDGHMLKVMVITGAEPAWAGAITGTSSTSGLPSANVVTTRNNSWVFSVSSDWSQKGLGTVGGSQTMIDEEDVAGQYTIHAWRQTSTTPSSGTTVTSNLTAPAAQQYNDLAVEIREALSTDIARPFSGSPPGRISPSGRWTQFPFDATPSGQTFSQGLAGSVTPTGVLALAVSKALTGSSTPTGALAKAVTKPGLAGSSTPTGALAKQANKGLAGTVTPTGALTRQANKGLTGTSTPTGALAKLASKALTGSSAPTGGLARQVNKALAGSVTPTGVLAAVKVVLRSFAGSVTPTGTLTKQAGKALTGSSTPTGTLTRQTGKGLTGAVTPVGALAKAVAKALAGSVTPTGVLSTTRVVLRSFAGSVTPTGVLTRQTNKALTGSSTPRGALARAVSKALAGTVTAVGALAKLVAKPFAGSSTPTGSLTATSLGATQNATSTDTVTAAYSSTPGVAAGRTSSSGVTGTRTSSPNVSDG